MPDVAGPFDLGSWSQAQWYRDAYARDRSGVYGLPAATLNDGDLSLAVNGLNWAVNLGRAHIRGSGYERTGSTVTGAFPANTSSNPRIDRLVLRRDLAAKTVTVVRLQGTPAASPLPPSLTRVEDGIWDLPMHRVTVPPNSGTVLTNPVDERPWLGTSGLQPIRSRFVVGTASGVLASGATANLCAPQVLPASVFDLGVPYQLDIDARLQMSIPSGAGAKLELFVNGALAGQDNAGNGGSGPATYTLKVRDVAYRTTDDQVTVSAVLTAIAGGLSSIGSGRLFITAQPYMAL